MYYPFTIKCLVFLAGFAILTLEVLGFRILVPHVGATLPVWASVIGVTLLGSALGYYAGGAIADRSQNKKILALFVFGAGLLFLAILPTRAVLPDLVLVVKSYSVTALLAALVLFLLPVLGLSSVITYTIRCSLSDIDSVARVHGNLYTIATTGSIVGIFIISYILIPNFTIPSIIKGIGALLIFTAAVIVSETAEKMR